MQKANEEYINNLQGQILTAQSDMVQKMAEIYKNSKGENGELTDAEQAQIADVYNTSMKLINGYAQQLNAALGNNADLSAEAFGTIDEYMQKALQSLTTSFDETFLSTSTGFNTLEGYMTNFKDVTNTLTSDLSTAWSTWQDNFSNIMETAGTSMTGFKDILTSSVADIIAQNDELVKSSNTLQQTVEKNYQDAGNEAYSFSRTHNGAIQQVIDKNEYLITGLDKIIEKEAGVTTNAHDMEEEFSNTPDYFSNVEDAAETLTGDLNSLANSVKKVADGLRLFSGEDNLTLEDFIKQSKEWESNFGNPMSSAMGFDTGGYTGSWGPSGKAAVLHEKEIVLNKDDTTNMLKAVGIVRDISAMIDNNANLASNTNLHGATIANNSHGTNQEVTIHAEFPNANNQYEIKAAFDNLINRASQYVNRK